MSASILSSAIETKDETVQQINQGLPVVQASDVKTGRLELTADVVIIGSGAGGAVTAYELARKGLDVLVLEAGPYVPSSEFTEDFTESLETLYEDHGGQANTDGDLLVLQGRCVGGSTVVNGCVSFRTPDFIFDEWHRDFGLTDFTSASMAPYFERVERNLSITENGPHEIARHSQIMQRGAAALGWSMKPFKRNIRECALTGHCLSGCKTERKQSMLVTYLPWAAAHGARIHSDTQVDRVTSEQGRATGVEGRVIDRHGKHVADISVKAERVIMAAGAVQTPVILQRSGLGNDQVGRNFACHPSMYVGARYPEPVHPWRGAMLGVYVDEFMHPDNGGFILEVGGLGIAELCMISEPGTGKPFVEYMEKAAHMAGIVTLIHDHNVGEIRWQGDHKEILYKLSDKDFPSMLASLKAAVRLHLAAGAEEVLLPTSERLSVTSVDQIDAVIDRLSNKPQHLRMVSYHPQGSCRMGTDPANSATDAEGRLRGVEGVWVADASLLPTSLIVNPQVTVYALANYVADRIG
ncbi:MAG: GMC family oxidoreductase [Alcanivorax sp.]|nr:GMC family oxidoreductase [Alcanivorax sp.]